MQAWRDLQESLALLSRYKNYFLGEFLPTLLGSLTQVDDARSKTNVRSSILAVFVKSDHYILTPIAYLHLQKGTPEIKRS